MPGLIVFVNWWVSTLEGLRVGEMGRMRGFINHQLQLVVLCKIE
jgi:hypothetical protein